jgi:RNA polymerase sigma-70 factor (ECF subfamily)
VLQETWLIAVRRMSDFDPRKGSFFDWLRGIAGNLIKNQNRKMQTARAAFETVAARTATTSETCSPSDAVERSARVSAALLALPDHYAAVLRAKYLEEQSVTDIALAWNQSAKAIESLLTRARVAFREQYEEDD